MSSVKLDNDPFNKLTKVDLKPFKLGKDVTQHVGYKKTLLENEFKNLKPKTKYKLLVEYQNYTQQGGNGSKATEYYDITRFCKPAATSRIENNTTSINDPANYLDPRTNSVLWAYPYFISNSEGRLSLSTFASAMWVLQNNVLTDWDKSSFDRWRENAKISFLLVPYSEVQINEATNTATTPRISSEQSPVVYGGPKGGSSLTTTDPTDVQVTTQKVNPSYIQTFYLDSNAVNSSKYVDLTDVTLFFRNKPNRLINRSGVESPSVTVSIVDVINGEPQIRNQYTKSIVDKPYTSIVSSSDATTPTVFDFIDPVRLETNKTYAILVISDDPEFELWSCVTGHRTVGTNSPSSGASKEHRGDLYENISSVSAVSNQSFEEIFIKRDNEDLKFEVGVAEYDVSNNVTISVTNNNDEFVVVTDLSSDFFATEYVYINTANSTGSVSISGGQQTLTGTGTAFTGLAEEERIVLIDSSNNQIREVVDVELIVSDTEVFLKEPVVNAIQGNYVRTVTGRVQNYFPETSKLILTDSTANTSSYISEGSTLVGVESSSTATVDSLATVPVSVFSTDIDMQVPSTYNFSGTYNFAHPDGDSYAISPSNESQLLYFEPNHIRTYNAQVLSRSLEITELSGDKSANIQISFVYNGPASDFTFDSPELEVDGVTFSTSEWIINNDLTNEHTLRGSASTKHISEKLTFAQGSSAEDIRVIYNSYRPTGTDIKCYAKIINPEDSEAFDDKSWTLLELKRGGGQVSSSEDVTDFREFEFGFPNFPPTETTLSGTVNTETQNGNNRVIGSGTTFTSSISAGDVIKIYNPLFPNDNYGVYSVDSVLDNTTLVLTEQVTNNNIIGSGLKIDTLSTMYTAFNNKDNSNIVRYFDSTGASYDTYDTVAIKTVLTSTNGTVVPKVNDYRVIAVSA